MNKVNKRFTVETNFLQKVSKLDLSLSEFILLMYFDNDFDDIFDVKKISKFTLLDNQTIMIAFDSLVKKGYITITSETIDGKLVDKISIDNIYNDKNDGNDKNNEFFEKFQSKYGNALSSMDFEIINKWLTNNISNDLIFAALDEAIYNSAISVKYIDKILFNWQSKGINTIEDLNNSVGNKGKTNEEFETKILDFDWLDEE